MCVGITRGPRPEIVFTGDVHLPPATRFSPSQRAARDAWNRRPLCFISLVIVPFLPPVGVSPSSVPIGAEDGTHRHRTGDRRRTGPPPACESTVSGRSALGLRGCGPRAAGGFAHHYTGDTALVTIEGVESRRPPVLRKYLHRHRAARPRGCVRRNARSARAPRRRAAAVRRARTRSTRPARPPPRRHLLEHPELVAIRLRPAISKLAGRGPFLCAQG